MIFSEVFSRVLLVFLLSSLYGLQRQKNHKPAGFGTFTLVAVGSCSLVLIASEFGNTYSVAIIGSVVTGIGFLGAGALLRNNDRVFGFATASSIWFFAIFGIVIGLGYYAIGFLIYVIVWLAVLFDNYLEEKGLGSYRRRVTITYTDFDKRQELSDILADYSKRFNLIAIQIHKKEKAISSTYLIEGMKKEIGLLLNELHKKKWCTSVKFE